MKVTPFGCDQHTTIFTLMVLASAADTTDLTKITDMADKIVEVAAPSVSAISHTSTDAKVEKLQAEVIRLADLVASLTQHHPRSPTPSDAKTLDSCWYHSKLGQAAKKCQEPCSWGNDHARR